MQVLERNRVHLPPEVNLPRTRKAETRVALPNAVPAARNLRPAAKKAAGVSKDHYLILKKIKPYNSLCMYSRPCLF